MISAMNSKIACLVVVVLAVSCANAFVPPFQQHNRHHVHLNLNPTDLVDVVGSAATQLEQVSFLDTLAEIPLAAKIAVGLSPLIPVFDKIQKVKQTERNMPTENMYPEAQGAVYEMSDVTLMEFGDAARVRPLLKQTQLQYRPLKVAYDANKDGYNAKVFHNKVDGKGAAVVLCKAGGKWFGGYNPRGWASLGGSRPSRASFLFYDKKGFGTKWQKLRVVGGGGMSCGNDLFDSGIYLGAEALVCPLDGGYPRNVRSRLGSFFESGPENRGTLLPTAGMDTKLQELKVLVGIYEDENDIPNSGGVLDLGLY